MYTDNKDESIVDGYPKLEELSDEDLVARLETEAYRLVKADMELRKQMIETGEVSVDGSSTMHKLGPLSPEMRSAIFVSPYENEETSRLVDYFENKFSYSSEPDRNRQVAKKLYSLLLEEYPVPQDIRYFQGEFGLAFVVGDRTDMSVFSTNVRNAEPGNEATDNSCVALVGFATRRGFVWGSTDIPINIMVLPGEFSQTGAKVSTSTYFHERKHNLDYLMGQRAVLESSGGDLLKIVDKESLTGLVRELSAKIHGYAQNGIPLDLIEKGVREALFEIYDFEGVLSGKKDDDRSRLIDEVMINIHGKNWEYELEHRNEPVSKRERYRRVVSDCVKGVMSLAQYYVKGGVESNEACLLAVAVMEKSPIGRWQEYSSLVQKHSSIK